MQRGKLQAKTTLKRKGQDRVNEVEINFVTPCNGKKVGIEPEIIS
jgi:hypothetical protein